MTIYAWNLVGPWVIGVGKSESIVSFRIFNWIFSSLVVLTDEIRIFHKFWLKAIGYGEFESIVRFSKFQIVFCNHSLDCREGHMKKMRLSVCLFVCRESKEHRFLRNDLPTSMMVWTSSNHTLSNMENSSNGVLTSGEFNQSGFEAS